MFIMNIDEELVKWYTLIAEQNFFLEGYITL